MILADSGQISSDSSCNLDSDSTYFQEKDSKGRSGHPCEVRITQGNGRGFIWANPTPEALLGYNQSTTDQQEAFYASGEAKEKLETATDVVMTATEVGGAVKGGAYLIKHGSKIASDLTHSAKNFAHSITKQKDLPTPSIAPKPTVTVNAKVGETSFSDVNQTARTGVDPEQPTLIAERIANKTAKSKNQQDYPNGTMGTAHAEIGTIQQAFNAGKTKGQSMTMSVSGKDVCGYCKGDIAAAAEKAGLKSLTINAIDNVTNLPKIYQWTPGMTTIKRTVP
ncbi:MAG: hypothetical protein RL122_466 [Pseudomonadota bacterium]